MFLSLFKLNKSQIVHAKYLYYQIITVKFQFPTCTLELGRLELRLGLNNDAMAGCDARVSDYLVVTCLTSECSGGR